MPQAFTPNALVNLLLGSIIYLIGAQQWHSIIVSIIGCIFIINGLAMSINLEAVFPTLGRYKLAQALIWMLVGYVLFFLGLRVLGVSLQAFGSYSVLRNLLLSVWVPVADLEKRVVDLVLKGPAKGLNWVYQVPVIGPTLRWVIRHGTDSAVGAVGQIYFRSCG